MGIYYKQLGIIPVNDNDRLRKLYRYHILNTPPEDSFDKIAKLAMDLFESTSAFISFVDRKKVFLKSDTTGQFERYTNREDSLCSWTILQDHVVVFNQIEDAASIIIDPDYFKLTGVNFYAATPIQTPDGYKIGALCVVDPNPKYPSEKQLKMLHSLGSIITDELEFRLATRNAVRVQTDLMNVAVHDLKNPLTSIKLYAQLIQREANCPNNLRAMTDRIIKSSDFILSNLNDLLNLSQIEDGAMKLKIEACTMDPLFKDLVTDFEIIANQKKQQLVFENHLKKPIAGDKMRLREIFENLLSNALKYSFPETTIKLIAQEHDHKALIEVRDKGQGLSEQDKTKLFKKFARLSAVPTGKERSNGLGLSIVKTLVELHSGKIWAESEGKGKGATFFVSLPLVES
ncbi:GAF domain-containing sensor histidine kinase [Olivibacter ginsenosidimutans]|uniref:histidine kinase n=1 Tax=Olivibacter ginsenosidimutans TaxID=1176537 RepID=A0ABP9B4B2_9SPHI